MNFHQETCHKVEFINEKKDRVMVLNIENLTKPLYQVFQKDLIFTSSFFPFLKNNFDIKLLTLNCLYETNKSQYKVKWQQKMS